VETCKIIDFCDFFY
jgi:hypothetical protein